MYYSAERLRYEARLRRMDKAEAERRAEFRREQRELSTLEAERRVKGLPASLARMTHIYHSSTHNDNDNDNYDV